MEAQFVDRAWVGAQLGRTLADDAAAIEACRDTPGCSPHPLVLPEYLTAGRGAAASPHPLIDVAALVTRRPDLSGAPAGPVAAWLSEATEDDVLPVPTGLRPTSVGEARAAAGAALGAWQRDEALRTAPRRSPDPPPRLLDDVPPLVDGPLVSVVMPMFDRAATVASAIASVQAQTHRHWELLVVDDGSTDHGLDLVNQIAAGDPRVVPVAVPHGGVCRARNEGLARARGEYVAFLDTDNRWRPGHLTAVVGAMARQGWSAAHDVLRATKDGETYHRAFEGGHEHLLVSNHVDLNVLVVRRDLLSEVGGFDPALRRFVDWDLVLRLAERTDLHLVPSIGVDYHDDHEPGRRPRISTTEPWTWLSVVAGLHLERHHREEAPPRPGLTSVLLPGAPPRVVLGWARALGAEQRDDVELLVVGSGLPLWRHLALSAVADTAPGVRFLHLPADRGRAVSANVALAAARGERTVLVLDDVRPDLDAVRALAAALDDSAVGIAMPLVDDEPAPGGAAWLAEASGPVLALRTAAARSDGGLDPLLRDVLAEADLSRRHQAAGHGGVVRLPAARVRRVRPPRRVDADRLADAERLLAERWPQRSG